MKLRNVGTSGEAPEAFAAKRGKRLLDVAIGRLASRPSVATTSRSVRPDGR